MLGCQVTLVHILSRRDRVATAIKDPEEGVTGSWEDLMPVFRFRVSGLGFPSCPSFEYEGFRV